MSAESRVVEMAELGFKLSGQSTPLGFALAEIQPTLDKLPSKLPAELEGIFTRSWPSDFFLGRIEFIGPNRINLEHEELYPGLTLVEHGFLCIGGAGGGDMFAYCLLDGRVYYFQPEYFGDSGIRSRDGKRIETNFQNIISVSQESWESLEVFFEWTLAELKKLVGEGEVNIRT